MLKLIISIFVIISSFLFQYHFKIFINNKQILLNNYKKPICSKLGLNNNLYGPEDFTYSLKHNLLFISSHNRRDMFNSLGHLFILNTLTDEIELLNITYPINFRPHGISIYEDCGSSNIINIFVISHRFTSSVQHVIEKFSYSVENKELKHIETLQNELLVAPNDLLALNCNEILVSNDHYTSNILFGLSHDLVKVRSADLTYYDGKNWNNLNKKVAFGNGLILHKDQTRNKEVLIRSSSADFSLLTYDITRSKDNNKFLESIDSVVSDEVLPFSPDNIEHDVNTGNIIITGHHSTTLFLGHAIFRTNAPSVVIEYKSPNNYETLYYDDGTELSAASVATRTKDKKKLYIGQVFNPYILVCVNPE